MRPQLTNLQRAMLRVAWRNSQAEGTDRDRERARGIGADAWAYEVLRDYYGFPYRPREGAGAGRRPLEWACDLAAGDRTRHEHARIAVARAAGLLAERGLVEVRQTPYGLGYDLTAAGGRSAASSLATNSCTCFFTAISARLRASPIAFRSHTGRRARADLPVPAR